MIRGYYFFANNKHFFHSDSPGKKKQGIDTQDDRINRS